MEGNLVIKRMVNERVAVHHHGETLILTVEQDRDNRLKLAFNGPQSFQIVRPDAVKKEPRDA